MYFDDKLEKFLIQYGKIKNNLNGSVTRGSFGKRMTSCPMQRVIRRLYIESGIYRTGLTINSLRHSYADNLRKKGVDLKVIKTLLGHFSLATTDRYLHVSSNDLKEAIL